jgi:hypothetical protein
VRNLLCFVALLLLAGCSSSPPQEDGTSATTSSSMTTTSEPLPPVNVTVNETTPPAPITRLYLYDCSILQLSLYAETEGLQPYVPEGYVARPVVGPMSRIVALFADCDASSTDNETHVEGGGIAWFTVPIDSTNPDDLNTSYGGTIALQGNGLAAGFLESWNYTQQGLDQTISGATPETWALATMLGNGSFSWSALGAPDTASDSQFTNGLTSLDNSGAAPLWITITGVQHGQFPGPCRHDGLDFGGLIEDWACQMVPAFGYSAIVTLNVLDLNP